MEVVRLVQQGYMIGGSISCHITSRAATFGGANFYWFLVESCISVIFNCCYQFKQKQIRLSGNWFLRASPLLHTNQLVEKHCGSWPWRHVNTSQSCRPCERVLRCSWLHSTWAAAFLSFQAVCMTTWLRPDALRAPIIRCLQTVTDAMRCEPVATKRYVQSIWIDYLQPNEKEKKTFATTVHTQLLCALYCFDCFAAFCVYYQCNEPGKLASISAFAFSYLNH